MPPLLLLLPRRLISSPPASRLLLLSRAERLALPPSSARALTVQLPSDGTHVLELELLLLCGPTAALAAYKNHCPHAGGPLTLLPHAPLRDGRVTCARHGAQFEWQRGVCLSAPCPGARLLPLEVDDGEEGVVAAAAELRRVAELGGGSLRKPLAEARGGGEMLVVPPRVAMEPYTPRRRRGRKAAEGAGEGKGGGTPA
ncbi:hypothetical protein AB1Y20_002751 [Prymnesium parvum]|uniref:Rieske domain-containing protein n=1 Tax=Prymnesium parvum TaxID=97485 RepID=A0AB34J9G9_PRYPA